MPNNAPTMTPPTALACLEIFGGNGEVNTAVAVPDIDAWVYSAPHEGSRGGDVHYITACGSGNIARILLADVAGHGGDVDPLARALRNAVRKNIETVDMRRLARTLNETLAQWETNGRFATAIVATYFAPSNQMLLLNAGHPRPVVRDAHTSEWRFVDADSPVANDAVGPRNIPLGIIEGVEYEQVAIGFLPGDALLLATDAVIETKDASGRMLGESGLIELLNSMRDIPDARMIPELVGVLESRRAGTPADDDLSLVLLRRNEASTRPLRIDEHARVWLKRFGLVDTAPSMIDPAHLESLRP